MRVYLKALNSDGEKLLKELVSQWSNKNKDTSFIRNIMLDKSRVTFTLEQENPALVHYEQPDFNLLPNNYKTRRAITGIIYSQFKPNGINETNVAVIYE